jgi:hypothetical protein
VHGGHFRIVMRASIPIEHCLRIIISLVSVRPPLWSSGQSSWLQIQRSRVRFPAVPDFLRNSGSGTGSTQPRVVWWSEFLVRDPEIPGSIPSGTIFSEK